MKQTCLVVGFFLSILLPSFQASGADSLSMRLAREQEIRSYSFEADCVTFHGIAKDPIEAISGILEESVQKNVNVAALVQKHLTFPDAKFSIRSKIDTKRNADRVSTVISGSGPRVIRYRDAQSSIDAVRQPEHWQANLQELRAAAPIWDFDYLGFTVARFRDMEVVENRPLDTGTLIRLRLGENEFSTLKFDHESLLTQSSAALNGETYITKWYTAHNLIGEFSIPHLIIEYRPSINGSFQVARTVLRRVQVNDEGINPEDSMSLSSPVALVDSRHGTKRALKLTGQELWSAAQLMNAGNSGRPLIPIHERAEPAFEAASRRGKLKAAIWICTIAAMLVTAGALLARRLRTYPA